MSAVLQYHPTNTLAKRWAPPANCDSFARIKQPKVNWLRVRTLAKQLAATPSWELLEALRLASISRYADESGELTEHCITSLQHDLDALSELQDDACALEACSDEEALAALQSLLVMRLLAASKSARLQYLS